MRWIFVALGAFMAVIGGLWTAEALGWTSGSAKEGVQFWGTVGPVLAGLGLALIWSALRGPGRNKS